jgi:hypothetical protein
MAGWLRSAAGVFGRRPAAVPQPYVVLCPCGARVDGERTDAHQMRACPGCRRELLIFPASVYPEPKRPPVAKRPAEPDLDLTESAPGEPLHKVAVPPPTPIQPTSSRAVRSSRASRQEQVAEAAAAASETIAKLRRKVFTPLKLAVLGIVVLVAVTGWYLVHRQRIAAAEGRLKETLRIAEESLQDRVWERADEFHRESVRLMDFLGREDSQARRVRQLSREVGVIVNLLPKNLADLVDEATGDEWGAGDLTWDQVFRASYRDSWIVIDATVEAAEEPGKVRIPAAVLNGDVACLIDSDLAVLEAIPAAELPCRVVIGAQFKDLRPEPGNEKLWRAVFDRETAFAWVFPQLLGEVLEGKRDALPDEGTIKVLERQGTRGGVEP